MGSHRRHLGRAVLIAAAVASCTPTDPTYYRPRPRYVDAGSPADCAQACAHMRALGCAEAEPTAGPDRVLGTADDGTCETVCENVEGSGVVTLDPRCVVEIAGCAEIEACSYGADP